MRACQQIWNKTNPIVVNDKYVETIKMKGQYDNLAIRKFGPWCVIYNQTFSARTEEQGHLINVSKEKLFSK